MKRIAFDKQVARLRNLLIQEMIDGCLKCQEEGCLCFEHHQKACDMILNPRKTRLAEEVKHLKKRRG